MKKILLVVFVLLVFIIGCVNTTPVKKISKKISGEKATFAGGCFWCMEAAFEDLPGVVDVVSGYAGGTEEKPTYSQVAGGKTSHREAIQITYSPKKITYVELLDYYWKQIDPTDSGGQFVDRGFQYTAAIFYHNQTQKKLAEKSLSDLKKLGMFDKPIVTKILPFSTFYSAEENHQDYSKKRTVQYKIYEKGSGRPQFKKKMWGK